MGTYLVRFVELGREQQARLGKQRRDLASVIVARWPDATVVASPGRIVVESATATADDIAQLPGLSSVSPCDRVLAIDLEATAVARAMRVLSKETSFAVRVKRDRRGDGESSMTVQRMLANAIVAATGAPVDLTAPDVTIGVEIRGDIAYVFDRVIEGIDRVGPAAPSAIGELRFVADQMLGRLAARLRLLGYDTLTVFDIADSEVTRLAAADGRLLLTRDRPLSRTLAVPVYYVEATKPQLQLAEVLAALNVTPDPARLFTRCTLCNATIARVDEAAVGDRLPSSVRGRELAIYQCSGCEQMYWNGSHVGRILDDLATSGVTS